MSFVKMERGWLDSEMFSDAPYSERDAWAWMICEARFVEGVIAIKGKPVTIGRGQLYSSIRFMSEKFQWSKDRVSRYLERLKKWGAISVETATGQNLITISNYNDYQSHKDAPKDTSKDSDKDAPKDKQEEILINSKNVLEHAAEEAALEAPPKSKPEKGKRLSAFLTATFQNIEIPQAWGDWAHEELRLSVEDINWEWEKFRDWWAAASGQKGVKADWFATWRNWMRKKHEDKARKEKLNELYTQKRY